MDVVAAPPIEAYQAPSAITESEIVAAYRRTAEARPCLCGGVVVADRIDPGPGLREHQQEPVHLIWRELQGLG